MSQQKMQLKRKKKKEREALGDKVTFFDPFSCCFGLFMVALIVNNVQ